MRTEPQGDGRTFPPEDIGYHATGICRNDGATLAMHALSPPLWSPISDRSLSNRCGNRIFGAFVQGQILSGGSEMGVECGCIS